MKRACTQAEAVSQLSTSEDWVPHRSAAEMGVVVHSCTPNPSDVKQEEQRVKVISNDMMSWRSVWDTHDPEVKRGGGGV